MPGRQSSEDGEALSGDSADRGTALAGRRQPSPASASERAAAPAAPSLPPRLPSPRQWGPSLAPLVVATAMPPLPLAALPLPLLGADTPSVPPQSVASLPAASSAACGTGSRRSRSRSRSPRGHRHAQSPGASSAGAGKGPSPPQLASAFSSGAAGAPPPTAAVARPLLPPLLLLQQAPTIDAASAQGASQSESAAVRSIADATSAAALSALAPACVSAALDVAMCRRACALAVAPNAPSEERDVLRALCAARADAFLARGRVPGADARGLVLVFQAVARADVADASLRARLAARAAGHSRTFRPKLSVISAWSLGRIGASSAAPADAASILAAAVRLAPATRGNVASIALQAFACVLSTADGAAAAAAAATPAALEAALAALLGVAVADAASTADANFALNLEAAAQLGARVPAAVLAALLAATAARADALPPHECSVVLQALAMLRLQPGGALVLAVARAAAARAATDSMAPPAIVRCLGALAQLGTRSAPLAAPLAVAAARCAAREGMPPAQIASALLSTARLGAQMVGGVSVLAALARAAAAAAPRLTTSSTIEALHAFAVLALDDGQLLPPLVAALRRALAPGARALSPSDAVHALYAVAVLRAADGDAPLRDALVAAARRAAPALDAVKSSVAAWAAAALGVDALDALRELAAPALAAAREAVAAGGRIDDEVATRLLCVHHFAAAPVGSGERRDGTSLIDTGGSLWHALRSVALAGMAPSSVSAAQAHIAAALRRRAAAASAVPPPPPAPPAADALAVAEAGAAVAGGALAAAASSGSSSFGRGECVSASSWAGALGPSATLPPPQQRAAARWTVDVEAPIPGLGGLHFADVLITGGAPGGAAVLGIVVECDGPSHFLRPLDLLGDTVAAPLTMPAGEQLRASGATRLRDAILLRAGFAVVSIPFWELAALLSSPHSDARVASRVGLPGTE